MKRLLITCLVLLIHQAGAQNIYPYTPTDWEGPLVVNGQIETYVIGDNLQEGYQLYLSYALQHDFPTALEGLDIEIQINGIPYNTRFFTSLSPASAFGWARDLFLVLPEGSHEIKIIIDPEDEFTETNENDNEVSIMVTVSPSPSLDASESSAIAGAEYFVDSDPGFGAATPIPVVQGEFDQSLNINVDLSAVSTGFHQFYVRARNEGGFWGSTLAISFINLQRSDSSIAGIEYFIDTDPGIGLATFVSASNPSREDTIIFTVPLGDVSTGFHQLYTRAKSSNGTWGPSQTTSFINLVAASNEIQLIEYFVDSDPGFGNAISVPFNPGSEEISFNVDLSSENTGFHQLFVRAKSFNGSWSTLQKAGFLVERGTGRNADIIELEYYYVGADGSSSLFTYEIPSPGKNLELIVPFNISFLENGLSYTVVVRAVDASGVKSLLTTESFTFNSNFRPEIQGQALSVNENSIAGFVIGQLMANDQDGDPLTFSLDTEQVGGAISLSSDGIVSILDSAFFNFEISTSLEFEVKVSDGKELDSANVTIDILDINDVPSLMNQSFVIGENSPNGTFIGQVEALDEDGDELSFLILSGNEDEVFSLSSIGELSVFDSAFLDFEEVASRLLELEVSDTEGATATGAITINLQDLNDPPVISNQGFALEENSPMNFEVGQILANDQDEDELVYSFTTENIDKVFALSSLGVLTVLDEAILNFEDTTFFEFEVKVSDGLLTDSAGVRINLLDVNDAPEIEEQQFVIDENPFNGAVIGQLTATDEDDDELNYAFFQVLNGDFDNALSVSTSGMVGVLDSTTFNFEELSTLQFEVSVSDPSGASSIGMVSVELNDINDIPVIETSIEDQSFEEGFEAATVNLEGPFVRVFVDEDDDDLSYQVNSSDENVVAVQEINEVLTMTEEGLGTATVTITAHDGNGGSVTEEFLVTVINVNDLPIMNNQSFSIDENSASGTVIGQLEAMDEDGDDISFSIVSGNTSNAFALSTTGELTVQNSSALDFETISIFSLAVEANDGNGGVATAIVSINLNNLDETILGSSPDQRIYIYPNPTTGIIVLEGLEGELEIRIVSLSGQVMYNTNTTSKREIDLSELPNGTYLLVLPEHTFKITKAD